MKQRAALVVALSLAASGCYTDIAAFASRWVTPDEQAFARRYLALMADGNVDSAFTWLLPDLQVAEARRQLTLVGRLLATADIDSLELIGVQVNDSPDRHAVNLSYITSAAGGWITTNVAMERADSVLHVSGFSATPFAESPVAANAFTLRGKHLQHYVLLVLPIVIIGFCLSAFVAVWRTPGMKRRRVWALVALVCGPVAALNWSSGLITIHPLSVLVLGLAMTRASPLDPWIVSIGFPIGAVVALSRRAAWRRRAAAETDVESHFSP